MEDGRDGERREFMVGGLNEVVGFSRGGVGAKTGGMRGTEESEGGFSHGGGEVHGAAIVGDNEGCVGN